MCLVLPPLPLPALPPMQAPILVFDVETVPDLMLLRNCDVDWDDLALAEVKDFPKGIYHIPVSICAMLVDGSTFDVIGGFKQTISKPTCYEDLLSAEHTLLKDFWAFTASCYQEVKASPRPYSNGAKNFFPVTFCGYNILGFDLPVLEQRSLTHHLQCPFHEFCDTGYESYKSRYSPRCMDLYQEISWNASQKCSLDEISTAIGLGGKLAGWDGSKVAGWFYGGSDMQQVEDYCAVDVLISYGLLLTNLLWKRKLNVGQYKELCDKFKALLLSPKQPKAYKDLARDSACFWQRAAHL